MNLLKSWFFNTVVRKNTNVFKIPQWTTLLMLETQKQLRYALKAHKEHLGDALPHTEIRTWKISPRKYYMVQDFVDWNMLYSQDLLENPQLQEQFDRLVEKWIAMENDKQLFFDIFGRNWFIKNLPQFFKKHPNFMYSNFILTPEGEIKFIDIWYLPMSNPIVWCAKQIRDYTSMRTKKYNSSIVWE